MDMKKYDFDIFLSHSSHDKQAVREIARKLKDAGLRIWFDEWAIKPGDDIYASIEQGLEKTQVLLLFMSSSAFLSDWVSLEKNTIMFRDPMNKSRRFVPVLLENCKLPDTISRYKYISAVNSIDIAVQEIIATFPTKNLDQQITAPNIRNLWREARTKSKIEVIEESAVIHDIGHKSNVFEALDSLSKKCKKEKLPSYLLYIDIDGFTLINSKFGVEAGDLILEIIFEILQATLKEHFVEIWGGDEFVCCLSGISKQEAEDLSISLIDLIANYEWKMVAPDLYVTASIGLSRLSQKKKEEETELWLERAIIGSYYAKRAGGNCYKAGPELLYKTKIEDRKSNYNPVIYISTKHGS